MLDALISLYAPHDCLSCGKEGSLLCAGCRSALMSPGERCYICHRLSVGNRTCDNCRRTSKLFAVHAATTYEGVVKELVARLKFSGARAASRPAGDLMAVLLPADGELIVPVPTASGRIRSRGYDQAVLLARELAKRASLPLTPVLLRAGQARQVGAGRVQRRQQLQGAFTVHDRATIAGRHVVLVDDVITTGATLETAAAVLKAAGAKRVSALVLARA